MSEIGASALKVLETDRLRLRRLSSEDAEFILQLLNEPSWLRFIGNKGVRAIENARDYILKGPVEMYSRPGFGLYLVETAGSMIERLLPKSIHAVTAKGFTLKVFLFVPAYSFSCAL
jgi:hypothetical protein